MKLVSVIFLVLQLSDELISTQTRYQKFQVFASIKLGQDCLARLQKLVFVDGWQKLFGNLFEQIRWRFAVGAQHEIENRYRHAAD